MSDQLAFAPFVRRSRTSREAAVSITPHVPSLQVRVLDYIKAHGPVTDAQIIDGLDLSPNSVRPRRIELTQLGLVRQNGTVRQPNGRNAATWAVISDSQG